MASALNYTPLSEIPTAVDRIRATFDSGRTKTLEWRVGQLEALDAMIAENDGRLLAALEADLHKATFESEFGELRFVRAEIKHALRHLKSWTKDQYVHTPTLQQLGTSRIVHEPFGVALIIGPWNYPFMLLCSPLVGAIAAGNTVAVKPSEIAVATGALVGNLLTEYLDNDAFAVIQGAVPETTELLAQDFDFIFFTGSPGVGRIVHRAAARNLTPTILELGGKSPCIVDATANIDVTARRITQGKYFNAGQTCVGADYVLAVPEVVEPLTSKIVETIENFYGNDPKQSEDYGRIVSDTAFERLTGLIEGEDIVCGGVTDAVERYISPTVLANVSPDAAVMQEEIFGPILPILTVADVDEAIRFVRARPKPLALYVFTSDDEVAKKVLDKTSSGGACVNECLMQLGVPDLPFGGVGASGMGAYHGKESYLAFTHRKGVLDKSTRIDPPIRYPPYTDVKNKIVSLLS